MSQELKELPMRALLAAAFITYMSAAPEVCWETVNLVHVYDSSVQSQSYIYHHNQNKMGDDFHLIAICRLTDYYIVIRNMCPTFIQNCMMSAAYFFRMKDRSAWPLGWSQSVLKGLI